MEKQSQFKNMIAAGLWRGCRKTDFEPLFFPGGGISYRQRPYFYRLFGFLSTGRLYMGASLAIFSIL
jgi:hypothetical protein